MKNSEFLDRLYSAALLQRRLNDILKSIAEEFSDCTSWEFNRILPGCYEKGGYLYDKDGNILSKETCSGYLSEKYYVNQSCGCCEDDYYGMMYYLVDDVGTVVEVAYEC